MDLSFCELGSVLPERDRLVALLDAVLELDLANETLGGLPPGLLDSPAESSCLGLEPANLGPGSSELISESVGLREVLCLARPVGALPLGLTPPLAGSPTASGLRVVRTIGRHAEQ